VSSLLSGLKTSLFSLDCDSFLLELWLFLFKI